MRTDRPRVEHLTNAYFKQYPEDIHHKFEREVFAYTELSEFVPRLIAHGYDWILVEGCTPLLSLHPRDSLKYRDDIYDLLKRFHERGYWHRDACVINIVIHPERGPLLIDFEHMVEATSNVSYDLCGAAASGSEPAWGQDWDGVWWGSEDTVWSPKRWWEDYA